MAQVLNSDVCVIGAGPAGSIIARSLAEFGHRVTIVEKAVFPRSHVGICLSDQTVALLNFLGIGKEISQANFLPRKTTVVKWETDEAVETDQPGVHLDRGIFDQILLNHAQSGGVQVLQPALVSSLRHTEEGGWQLSLTNDQTRILLNTRILVDASGRGNALKCRKKRSAPPLFALHGTWKLNRLAPYDGFMEAGKDSWLWMAQLKGERAMISLYTDPKHFSQSHHGNLEALYFNLLKEYSLLDFCDIGDLLDEIKGCDASSRHAAEPIGDDFIKVGDASMSVDPMASQGVHLALTAGTQAAIVVNTMLRHPDRSQIAKQFYRDRQMEKVEMYTQKTALVYAKASARIHTPFWKIRSEHTKMATTEQQNESGSQLLPEQTLQLSPEAKILPTPVLGSTVVENKPALHHPNLDRPVAFLGGENIVKLLARIESGQSASAIQGLWEPLVEVELGKQIINWLWDRRILVSSGK